MSKIDTTKIHFPIETKQSLRSTWAPKGATPLPTQMEVWIDGEPPTYMELFHAQA